MPNDNVLTDDHAFQLYLLARRTSDWARWINELRASIAAHPGQPEPQPRAHQWDKYGERCELCGDKDWMPDSPCRSRTPEPRAEVTEDDKLCADRYRWLRDGGIGRMPYSDHGQGPEYDFTDADVDAIRTGASS